VAGRQPTHPSGAARVHVHFGGQTNERRFPFTELSTAPLVVRVRIDDPWHLMLLAFILLLGNG